MKNIEKSEIVIAKILEKLMEFGLQPANLEFSELGLDESYETFYKTCSDWLIHEGIIRVQAHHIYLAGGSMLDGVMLTAHGFAILGQKITGAEKEMAVGEAIKQVADTKVGLSQFGDFFGGLLGGFSKSLGS